MATYTTSGQIKTVKLPDCTFKIEPLSDYRFKTGDGKDDVLVPRRGEELRR